MINHAKIAVISPTAIFNAFLNCMRSLFPGWRIVVTGRSLLNEQGNGNRKLQNQCKQYTRKGCSAFQYITHLGDVVDLYLIVVAQVFAQFGNENIEAAAVEVVVVAPN